MYITDEKIRALYNLASMSPNALDTPNGESRAAHRLGVATDCALALGLLDKAACLSDDAEQQLRDAARERCVEHLKTVKDIAALNQALAIRNALAAKDES